MNLRCNRPEFQRRSVAPFFLLQKYLEELTDSQTKREAIRENFATFALLCDVCLLQATRERIEELEQEWQRIEERLRSKISFLEVIPDDELFLQTIETADYFHWTHQPTNSQLAKDHACRNLCAVI